MTGQSAGPGDGCQWHTSTSTLDPAIRPRWMGDGSGSLTSELGDMQPDGGYTHQRMGSHPQDQLAGGAGDTTN